MDDLIIDVISILILRLVLPYDELHSTFLKPLSPAIVRRLKRPICFRSVAGDTKRYRRYVLHSHRLSENTTLCQEIGDSLLFVRVEVLLVYGLCFSRGSTARTSVKGSKSDVKMGCSSRERVRYAIRKRFDKCSTSYIHISLLSLIVLRWCKWKAARGSEPDTYSILACTNYTKQTN